MPSSQINNTEPGHLPVRRPTRYLCTPSQTAVDHNGMGLSDMGLTSTYSSYGRATLTVTIATAASPDTFDWTLVDDDNQTINSNTGVSVAASVVLGNGLTLTFGATTGHTVGSEWVVGVDSDSLEARTSNALDAGYAVNVRGNSQHQSGSGLVWLLDTNVTSATARSRILLRKSRGTRVAQTVVVSGDDLGSIEFQGHDGTDYGTAARILGESDGVPGAGDMPGRLVFQVSADGSESPTTALTLSNDLSATFAGAVGITGALSPASLAVGGGFGDTGVTISGAGVIQADGAVSSAAGVTAGTALTGATLEVGGGFGDTGLSATAIGGLSMNGDLVVSGSANVAATFRAPLGSEDSGSAQNVNMVFTVQPVATDMMVVGADTYEFDGVGGNINVVIAGAAAGTLSNLVTAVNGSGTELLVASNPGTSLILRSASTAGGTVIAANNSIVLDATSNMTQGHVFDSGDVNMNTLGALAAGQLKQATTSRTVNAAHVTAGTLTVVFDFTPTWFTYYASNTGAAVLRTESVGISGNTVAFSLAGGAAPNVQSGDVLVLTAGE